MRTLSCSLFFIFITSSLFASELKFGGKVSTTFDYYEGQTDDVSSGTTPVLDGAGGARKYKHRKLDFEKAELQLKHKDSLDNGLSSASQIVLELKSKNTFDIEEASTSLANEKFKVSVGILQDTVKEYYGQPKDAINIGALEHTFGDEKPAVRFHYMGMDKLTLDTKVRLYEKGSTGNSSTSPSRQVTEALIQSGYEDSWGEVHGSVAYEKDKIINENQYTSSPNNWKHTGKIYNFVIKPKYKIYNPFFTYTRSVSTDRAATARTTPADTKIFNYVLGIDVEAVENLIVTGVYLHQVKDRILKAYAIAASYEFKPFDIQLGYSHAKNNASAISSGNKDYCLSGVKAYLTYKF